ncbi:MAG: NAD(P)-dependent oxidoreductase [Acidobacteria bacterium]|nr:NAD(P)-dependent oxidoreductase [Acidobacteriota bacterium]
MTDLSALGHIAITGATGFIGSHLVQELVSRACYPTLLARKPLAESLCRMEMDLAEPRSIWRAMHESKPDTLFHLAGVLGRGDSRAATLACAELNINATLHVLDAAMEARVRRIVIIGSAEEYGEQDGPMNENLPTQPVSPYGIAKAATTRFAQALHKRSGCPVVIVRPFSVYGPGQPTSMFIAQAVEAVVRNLPFHMSHGEQQRDLLYVDDLVRGLIAAATVPNIEGQVINLGSGQPVRLRDVAQRIWYLANSSAPLLIGARQATMEQLHDTWADISRAHEMLGWTPQIGLDNGLRATIRNTRTQFGFEVQECQVA